jgi:hypothetical protein
MAEKEPDLSLVLELEMAIRRHKDERQLARVLAKMVEGKINADRKDREGKFNPMAFTGRSKMLDKDVLITVAPAAGYDDPQALLRLREIALRSTTWSPPEFYTWTPY